MLTRARSNTRYRGEKILAKSETGSREVLITKPMYVLITELVSARGTTDALGLTLASSFVLELVTFPTIRWIYNRTRSGRNTFIEWEEPRCA